MIQSFLLLGCIFFFILLVYSFQVRNRMYKDYGTSCDIIYFPKKEKIIQVEEGEAIKFKPDESYLLYNPQTIQGF